MNAKVPAVMDDELEAWTAISGLSAGSPVVPEFRVALNVFSPVPVCSAGALVTRTVDEPSLAARRYHWGPKETVEVHVVTSKTAPSVLVVHGSLGSVSAVSSQNRVCDARTALVATEALMLTAPEPAVCDAVRPVVDVPKTLTLRVADRW